MNKENNNIVEGLIVIEVEKRFRQLLEIIAELRNHNRKIELAIDKLVGDTEIENKKTELREVPSVEENIPTFGRMKHILFSNNVYFKGLGISDKEAIAHLENEETKNEIIGRLVSDFNFVAPNYNTGLHNNGIINYQTIHKSLIEDLFGTSIFTNESIREIFKF